MQAIEHLNTIAGATAVYAASEFDRCLRDARTAVQHTMTPFVRDEIPGKQFVGLDNHDSSWAFDDRGDAG
jgi:Acyl-CoA dehydrogenase, C-terminal domain